MSTRAARVTAAVAVLLTAPAPAAAKRESSFVLSGYRVEHRLSVQLDADGRPDRALVLRRKKKLGAGISDRRLVVLRSDRSGGYSAAGEGRRILLCSSCGGAFFGTLDAPVRLSSKDTTLIVKQSFGSRTVTEQTFRLALRQAGAQLIGYDELERDRATGAWTSRSTNLLTRVRITEQYRPGRRIVRKTSSLDVEPIMLSRVDRDHPLRGSPGQGHSATRS